LFLTNLDHGGPDGMVWYGMVWATGDPVEVTKFWC